MASNALDGHTLADLSIVVESTPHQVIVTLVGQVDVHARTHIENLQSYVLSFTGELVIRAQEVSFIDSYAVSALKDLVERHPGKVTLLNPSPTIVFLLETAKIRDSLTISQD